MLLLLKNGKAGHGAPILPGATAELWCLRLWASLCWLTRPPVPVLSETWAGLNSLFMLSSCLLLWEFQTVVLNVLVCVATVPERHAEGIFKHLLSSVFSLYVSCLGSLRGKAHSVSCFIISYLYFQIRQVF